MGFFQGGTIKPLVNCLKIARKEERDRSKIISDVNRKTVEHLMAGVESVAGRLTIGSVYSMIETFDNMVRVFFSFGTNVCLLGCFEN